MQHTDLLPDLGRPSVYFSVLARALGSLNAAILLCQLIYWLGKEANPELGIYKTKAALTAETGLNRNEQDIATARLKQLGLVTTNYQRMQHRMYYLLHTDALQTFWETFRASSPKVGSSFPESRNELSRKLDPAFPKVGSSFPESWIQLSGKQKRAFDES